MPSQAEHAATGADDSHWNLEYPSVYKAADAAALRKQRWYFWTVRFELGAILLASVPAALPMSMWLGTTTGYRLAAAITASLLAIGLLARVFRTAQNFEERWFESRALAESVKVETWRYVMGAEPYHQGSENAVFAGRLDLLAKSAREIFGQLDEQAAMSASHVTPSMSSIRQSKVNHRRDTYFKHRIQDQLKWYRAKAKMFGRKDTGWAVVAHVCEAGALVFAIVATVGALELGIMGTLTTLAAAVTAWIQSKDFRRLATTYNFVAHDLQTIVTAGHPKTEPGLRALVDAVEHTLSREHTLWLDRRIHH